MSQGVPGEWLVFSLCWSPEDAGFNAGISSSVDQVASNSEGKWTGTKMWGSKLGCAFLLQIVGLRTALPGVPRSLGLVDSRCSQVDN